MSRLTDRALICLGTTPLYCSEVRFSIGMILNISTCNFVGGSLLTIELSCCKLLITLLVFVFTSDKLVTQGLNVSLSSTLNAIKSK